MATETLNKPMTGDEMIALSKKHTLFEWSAQSKVDPIPVARAKGIYFWTPEGKRFIDFNSQLMCVNIGHGDERVINAIHEQASVLAYANPFMATEPRARLGAKLAEITRAIARTTARPLAASRSPAIRAAGPPSPASPASSTCWIRTTGSRAAGTPRRSRWPCWTR